MQRFQPAWWQLYLIAAVVVAVLYLQHQLGLTPWSTGSSSWGSCWPAVGWWSGGLSIARASSDRRPPGGRDLPALRPAHRVLRRQMILLHFGFDINGICCHNNGHKMLKVLYRVSNSPSRLDRSERYFHFGNASVLYNRFVVSRIPCQNGGVPK